MRRLSVLVLASLLLVAGMTPASGAAADEPRADDAPVEFVETADEAAAGSAESVRAKPGALQLQPGAPRPPAFEASIVAETPLRPQGSGRFRIVAARQRVVAVPGGLRLTVRLPRGVITRAVAAPGWNCRKIADGARLRCQHKRTVRPTSAPEPIVVHVATTTLWGTGRRSASVRMHWRTGDGKREHETGHVRPEVLPPLRAAMTTAVHKVKGTPVRQRSAPAALSRVNPRVVTLTGRVRGAEGRPIAHRFRQLCTTAKSVRRDDCEGRAEPVRWVTSTGYVRAARAPRASFAVPRVSRRTPLLFAMEVTGDGARDRDVHRIVVQPRTAGQLRARALADQPTLSGTDRSTAVGHRQGPGLGLRIAGGQRPLVVRAGATVRLRAATTRRAIGFRWSTVSGPSRLLDRRRDRAGVTFVAPQRPRRMIVGVTATDSRGRTWRRDRIVEVVKRTDPTMRQARVAAASDTVAESAFCVAFGIVSAAPGDARLGSVSLRGVTTTGTCGSDGATIGFTSVTIGGDTIALSGQIDATGILTGTYTPSLDLVGVAVDSISVTASLADDGSITGLTGSASATGVPFVTLPTGWTGTTLLTLTTAGVTLKTDATDGVKATSGHLGLTGTMNFDGTFSLTATAANLAVLTTAAAGDATASGTGTISRATPSGAIAYDVTASFTTGAGPDVELFDNVTLSNATASLSDAGIQVAADLTILAVGADLDLDIAGAYRSSTDYRLSVTQPSPWRSHGVSLSNLTGTVADNGVLTFNVAGSATDSELSGLADLSDASLSAQVANTCPPGGGDPSCKDTEVRLNLTLTADVTVPGATEPVPLQATATVDFGTMDYSFDGTLPGTFGPSEFNLSDLHLTVSDDSTAPICDAGSLGDGGGGGNDLYLGFSGKAAVMGVADAHVSGVFSGDSDYCLQVDLAGAGFSPDGGSGGGSSAFTAATLLYATSTMTVTAPGGPGGTDQTVTVAKRSPTLIGTFQTPQTLQDIFDNDLASSGAYSAAVTLNADSEIDGFDGTVDLPLRQAGALLAGTRGGTSLTLNSVEVDVSYDTDQSQASLGLSVDGDFNTDGGGMPPTEGTGDDTFVITGQSTPIAGQITATLSAAGSGISFDVGIDPTQTTGCPAGASPCITDAFGQPGLTVSTLSVGGSIRATDAGVSPAVDVAADVDLPHSWTSSFGADSSVPASLDAQVSEVNPCFSVTIGNPDGEQAVVSLVDGLFTADYAEVAIAPTGCTFQTPSGDVDIPAGSSLAFDGSILGDPIAFNAIMGTDGDGDPYVKATVQSAPIDFAGGAITVTDPTAGSDGGSSQQCATTATSNDNSPAAGGPFVQVDTSADGGASVCGSIDVGDTDLGGAGVTVMIDYRDRGGVPSAWFMVEADLSPGGFPIAQAQLQGQYAGGASPTLDISLNAQTSALAVGVGLEAQLDYEGGVLDSADFRYYTNADIFGIFDVSVGFDLAYAIDPKTKVGSTTFSYSASASLFGFSLFHFGGTIFTTAGGFQADGSPIPPPPPPPRPPIQIAASQILDDGFVEIMSQLGYMTDTTPGSTFAACKRNDCYYLYRDVSAPIAPDGSIATSTGKPGGTPDGLLLVCYATRADQRLNLVNFTNEMQQMQLENPGFEPPQPPAIFTDPNIRSATGVPSDPTGTDGCVSLDATYNVDAAGNLYIASASSFDWSQLKALGAQT